MVSTFKQDIDRDGLLANIYFDGSIRFIAHAPGKEPMFNELLRDRRKRAEKIGCREFGVDVIVAPWSTRLDYYTGNKGFLTIDSDLDRSHRPQAWARGLLPIIPFDRFKRWYDGESVDWLRFESPKDCSTEIGEKCLRAYLILILSSWRRPADIQHTTALMNELGFRVSSKEIRKALDGLVTDGFLEVNRRVRNRMDPGGMWVFSDRVRRYVFTRLRPIHGERDGFQKSLFEAFVPFLVRK